MFNKIIEFFYPFTNDPNKFVLKNEATFYSNKYRHILYSGNGGKTFKKVHEASSPLFSHGDSVLQYDWSFEPLTFDVERTSFSVFKNKFKSLDDINKFHEDEYEKYQKGLKSRILERERYINMINKNINGE